MSTTDAQQRVADASTIGSDLRALTACGGRLVGSASEEAAYIWLQHRLSQLGVQSVAHEFEYASWASRKASLELIGAGSLTSLRCHPLYWSGETQTGGIEANIVDVGRGTEADFSRWAKRIPGSIIVTRHEYPFSSSSIHRRVKYARSCELGAAGFVIANDVPGDLLVTGSCGLDAQKNIPAVGVSLETGAALAAAASARARLSIVARRQAKKAANLIAEAPGLTPEWVVLCAHYDGHDLAQSALDNATGVVAAIAIFARFQPLISRMRRGLRLVLFTAEETGLLGSRLYLQSIGEAEHRKIGAAINLDTLAGSTRLTCLTSGFNELQSFIERTFIARGVEIRCFPPLLRNSDHFNFAQCGIPALRLIAGFDEPESGARFVLTEGDTSDRISMNELAAATEAAGTLVRSALDWPHAIAPHRIPIAAP